MLLRTLIDRFVVYKPAPTGLETDPLRRTDMILRGATDQDPGYASFVATQLGVNNPGRFATLAEARSYHNKGFLGRWAADISWWSAGRMAAAVFTGGLLLGAVKLAHDTDYFSDDWYYYTTTDPHVAQAIQAQREMSAILQAHNLERYGLSTFHRHDADYEAKRETELYTAIDRIALSNPEIAWTLTERQLNSDSPSHNSLALQVVASRFNTIDKAPKVFTFLHTEDKKIAAAAKKTLEAIYAQDPAAARPVFDEMIRSHPHYRDWYASVIVKYAQPTEVDLLIKSYQYRYADERDYWEVKSDILEKLAKNQGNSDVAIFVKDLIKSGKLSDWRLIVALEALVANAQPDDKEAREMVLNAQRVGYYVESYIELLGRLSYDEDLHRRYLGFLVDDYYATDDGIMQSLAQHAPDERALGLLLAMADTAVKNPDSEVSTLTTASRALAQFPQVTKGLKQQEKIVDRLYRVDLGKEYVDRDDYSRPLVSLRAYAETQPAQLNRIAVNLYHDLNSKKTNEQLTDDGLAHLRQRVVELIVLTQGVAGADDLLTDISTSDKDAGVRVIAATRRVTEVNNE